MLIPQVGDIIQLKETLYKDVYILVTSLETSKRFFSRISTWSREGI